MVQEQAANGKDAIQEGGYAQEYLTYTLGPEEYAIDILKVQEIRGYETPTTIANAPDFLKGVINLRGTIVPVIDLRIRFGLTRKPTDSNSRIIIMKAENLVVGIIVDHIRELLRLDPDSFQPPPKAVVKIDAEYFKEVAQLEDRLLIVLDITRLLTETSRKSN